MLFKQLSTGGDRNFSYLIGDEETRKAAIIDPSDEFSILLKEVNNNKLKVIYIINTHAHYDHIAGNSHIKNKTNAKIVAHKIADIKKDIGVDDKDILKLGNLKLEIIFTPGHYKDHICILVEDKLLTGDALFVGCIGGTHFQGSNAKDQYNSLFNKILKLKDNIQVYPGHDYGAAPYSTIGYERKTNPFLLCKDFNEFVWLKEHWEEYKKEHNIK